MEQFGSVWTGEVQRGLERFRELRFREDRFGEAWRESFGDEMFGGVWRGSERFGGLGEIAQNYD